METIGPSELLIILLVLVAIFGASRLPKMACSLGEGIGEFRTAIRDARNPSDGDRADGDSASNTTVAERPVKNGDPSRSTP